MGRGGVQYFFKKQEGRELELETGKRPRALSCQKKVLGLFRHLVAFPSWPPSGFVCARGGGGISKRKKNGKKMGVFTPLILRGIGRAGALFLGGTGHFPHRNSQVISPRNNNLLFPAVFKFVVTTGMGPQRCSAGGGGGAESGARYSRRGWRPHFFRFVGAPKGIFLGPWPDARTGLDCFHQGERNGLNKRQKNSHVLVLENLPEGFFVERGGTAGRGKYAPLSKQKSFRFSVVVENKK